MIIMANNVKTSQNESEQWSLCKHVKWCDILMSDFSKYPVLYAILGGIYNIEGNKALTDRIRIRISYPKGQRIGFSFVIQIDVPKSEQIRILAQHAYLNIRWSGTEGKQPFFFSRFNSPRAFCIFGKRRLTVYEIT